MTPSELPARSIGSAATEDLFDTEIDESRCRADGQDTIESCSAPTRPAYRGEKSGNGEPKSGVVGGLRQHPDRPVEAWGRGPRDCVVGRAVDGRQLARGVNPARRIVSSFKSAGVLVHYWRCGRLRRLAGIVRALLHISMVGRPRLNPSRSLSSSLCTTHVERYRCFFRGWGAFVTIDVASKLP